MIRHALLFLLSLFFILGCSENESNYSSGFTNFYTSESVDPTRSENLDYRNQVYVSDSLLLNFRESLFINISGRLLNQVQDEEDMTSSLEIFSYSSPQSLNGSVVRLTPTSDVKDGLAVEIFTPENNAYPICEIPFALAPDGFFNLSFQFDNFQSGGRVTVWNEYRSPEGYRELNASLYNINTSACTTQGQTVISTLGEGQNWGFVPKMLKVFSVERKVPYDL